MSAALTPAELARLSAILAKADADANPGDPERLVAEIAERLGFEVPA